MPTTKNDDRIVFNLIMRHQRPGDGLVWTAIMISKHTGLSPQRTKKALGRLVKWGKIEEKDGAYRVVIPRP